MVNAGEKLVTPGAVHSWVVRKVSLAKSIAPYPAREPPNVVPSARRGVDNHGHGGGVADVVAERDQSGLAHFGELAITVMSCTVR